MAQLKADSKAIFAIFVGALIGVVILIAIANQINLNTNTRSTTNETVTLGAVNATTDITGRTLLTRVAVTNATEPTSDIPVLALATGVSTTSSLESVQIVSNDTGQDQGYTSGTTVNVSYSYEPDGFVRGAANPVVLLILIFASLAILTFVIAKLMGGSLSNLMKI